MDTAQPTTVDVPGWRHPNLRSATVKTFRYGSPRWTYDIRPFDGTEPEPAMPEQWRRKTDDEPNWDLYHARQHELKAIRQAWAQARFHRLFAALYQPGRDNQLLEQFMRNDSDDAVTCRFWRHPVGYTGTAGDKWKAYTTARDELTAAYEAMKTQPDTHWRSGLGRIVDATDPAYTAASNWDNIGRNFVALARWCAHYIDPDVWPGPQRAIDDAGKKLGLDVAGWCVPYDLDEYSADSIYADTARSQIARIVKEGDAWLRAVDERAGRRR